MVNIEFIWRDRIYMTRLQNMDKDEWMLQVHIKDFQVALTCVHVNLHKSVIHVLVNQVIIR
jgi:hypothetical protein